MRFFEWDYGHGIAAEYERQGECRKCGICCRQRVHFAYQKPPYKGEPRNGGKSTDGEGVWLEVQQGRWRHFYKIKNVDRGEPCSSLGNDNLCACHDHKPLLCTVWPITPKCIEAFPDCGFSFKEIRRWAFESDAGQ